MNNKKKLDEDKVRVIKISKEALFEFIYENFIDKQETFFDVNAIEVADAFDIDYELGEFIFGVYKAEDKNGNILTLPKEIDLQQIMKKIPDTTDTLYGGKRYREFTKDELIELSKEDTKGKRT